MVLASPTSTLPGWRAPRPASSCTRRTAACHAFQSLTRGFLPEQDPLQRWVVCFILGCILLAALASGGCRRTPAGWLASRGGQCCSRGFEFASRRAQQCCCTVWLHSMPGARRLSDPRFAAWEDALSDLPKYAVAAGRGELWRWLEALPEFPTAVLLHHGDTPGTSHEIGESSSDELWRAYLLLSFLAHVRGCIACAACFARYPLHPLVALAPLARLRNRHG